MKCRCDIFTNVTREVSLQTWVKIYPDGQWYHSRPDRAEIIYKDELLEVKVLHPLDFLIAKLRRLTEEDLQDALFLAEKYSKYSISTDEIKEAAEQAVLNSPKDTALFQFRKNVEFFAICLRKINKPFSAKGLRLFSLRNTGDCKRKKRSFQNTVYWSLFTGC